jgi:hypothetical protein
MEESAGILKFKLIHISALIMNFVLMGLLQIMLSYSVTFSASNYSQRLYSDDLKETFRRLRNTL